VEIVSVAIGFLGFVALGDVLVARLSPRWSDHRLERALAGFGLVFGVGAYTIHALGFLGLLYKPLAWAILGICAAAIAMWARRGGLRAVRQALKERRLPRSDIILAAGLCAMAAVNILGCLTPEIRYDCLINHQSIPAGFANAHRIEIHPYNVNMGRPQLIHMYYALPLLFHDVFGPKLIHTMIALVGLAALGWTAARTCEKGALWPSLYLFYSLPVVTLYATCAYIDLGRIYYEVFPLWLVLRYQQGRRKGDLLLAAVIFGFGMGVHMLSSLFGWPAMAATVFFAVLFGGGEGRWKRALASSIAFALVSAVVFSPWIVRNCVLMGNPNPSLFPVPAGADQPQHLLPELGGYIRAIGDLPRRLYGAIVLISKTGNCPPLLLVIALVLKFAVRDRDPRRATMFVFALLHLVLFALTMPLQDGRYILPGFAVSVVLFFHYVEHLLGRAGAARYRPYVVGGVLALGLLNFANSKYRLYTDYREVPWPVLSASARAKYLDERLGGMEIARYLNEHLPPRSKVLLENMVGPLYLWRPFMARNPKDPPIFYTFLRRTKDNRALAAKLHAWGITHILVEGDFRREGLTPEQQRRLDEFVARRLRFVHTEGRQKLYEIVRDRAEKSPQVSDSCLLPLTSRL